MAAVRPKRILLVLLGVLTGVCAGLALGRVILLRSATAALSEYARTLTSRADEIKREVDTIFQHVDAAQIPFCSDQDIAALRAQTFRFFGFKDIGRTRDGKLYCSAALGRLAQPFKEGRPTLSLPSGLHIYTGVPIVMASADRVLATVVEQGSVDAVVSPDAFAPWDRPHTRSMIAIVDPSDGRVVRLSGSDLHPSSTWLFSGGGGIKDGAAYQVQCSRSHPLCVVTTETLADIWAQTGVMQEGYAVMGAMAGFSIFLAFAFLNLRRDALVHQLHRALRSHSRSLSLVYQPLLDLGTRQCVGAEALLRWVDRNGAAISPDTFIPLAEQGGFIGEVTEWVIATAAEELGDLLRGDRTITLSVNIAATDLDNRSLYDLLDQHVVQAGIYPRQIAIELTERSTADLDLLAASIRKLSESGYKVHIDDFGVGYSNLSYLDHLLVDAIKIDRSFTRSIGTNAVIAPVLPQILALAKSLGMEVVVEGVETEAQAEYLKASGQRLDVQGWLFGKPMDAAAFTTFCKKSKSAAHACAPDGNQAVPCRSEPVASAGPGAQKDSRTSHTYPAP
jgi:sensor c-di-GMP phosphodiesterase-like protein